MKLQTLRRGTAAAAVLTLSLTLAACGDDEEPTSSASDPGTSETTPADETPAPEESSEPATDPEFSAVFGDACSQLPADGEPGSLTGMVVDPVATAAGTNPLLKTLVAAVTAVEGLPGALNDAPAITVFAPYDGAFAEIPEADLNALLEGAAKDGIESPLATVLSHHVLGERLEPDAIAGEQTTLIGDSLTIEGDSSGMTVSDGKVTANVLCGGIPTANATVYVIDKVLTNAKPAS